MHSYATDPIERKIVPLFIAVMGILTAWFFYSILGTLLITLPWWIEAPSVIGFYYLCYAFFNKYLWRWWPFRIISAVKVPDLNGTWKGHLISSFDEHAARQDATIKISQSWTQISIILETSNSKSHSLIAAIIMEKPTGAILSYEYLNEPLPNAPPTMYTHRGTARLTIQANWKEFEGEYYSGRGRQTFGILKFKRQ